MKILPLIIAALALAGCASANQEPVGLSTGAAAYEVIPSNTGSAQLVDYRIGPLDSIDVTVFQEPDLSAKAIRVDASGRIALPLIGTVEAVGKTASELARELEVRYDSEFLRDPTVTVTVVSSVTQKVVVQGEVAEPGVFPITGPTTLLEVISMAKGETDVATLDQVVVFRTIEGQRMGAIFNVADIRRGAANDPAIQGNDLVVVGYSAARRFWRNILLAAPLFNVFRPVL